MWSAATGSATSAARIDSGALSPSRGRIRRKLTLCVAAVPPATSTRDVRHRSAIVASVVGATTSGFTSVRSGTVPLRVHRPASRAGAGLPVACGRSRPRASATPSSEAVADAIRLHAPVVLDRRHEGASQLVSCCWAGVLGMVPPPRDAPEQRASSAGGTAERNNRREVRSSQRPPSFADGSYGRDMSPAPLRNSPLGERAAFALAPQLDSRSLQQSWARFSQIECSWLIARLDR